MPENVTRSDLRAGLGLATGRRYDYVVEAEPAPATGGDEQPASNPGNPNPLAPMLIKVVNALPPPAHGVDATDYDGIARAIAHRALEGVADVFAHPDYDQMASGPDEEWARSIAEHQTGIPYTMPLYFYDPGAQPKIFAAIRDEGRYPLAGQCQQSVSTTLGFFGWDGGPYGDIGSGTGTPGWVRQNGTWHEPGAAPQSLAGWSDALWQELKPGWFFIWAKTPGIGHVAVVMRKHPTERKVQLWDTRGSGRFDMEHPKGRAKKTLYETEWCNEILWGGGSNYHGVGVLPQTGTPRTGLKPRGFLRLAIWARSSGSGVGELLYLSDYLRLEEKGTPTSWLFRSMRGAPHHEQLDARWLVQGEEGSKYDKAIMSIRCTKDGFAQFEWCEPQVDVPDGNGGTKKAGARFHKMEGEGVARMRKTAAKGVGDPFA